MKGFRTPVFLLAALVVLFGLLFLFLLRDLDDLPDPEALNAPVAGLFVKPSY